MRMNVAQSGVFAAPAWGICALTFAIGIIAPFSGAQTVWTQGEVISRGQQPVTKTWDEIVAQDRKLKAARAAAGSAENRIDAAPMPDMDWANSRRKRSTQTRAANGEIVAVKTPLPASYLGTTFGFDAINMQDQFNSFGQASIPPDTMGAVGPNHFVEAINTSFAIYTRAGALLSHVNETTFFAFTFNMIDYPRTGAFDPRIVYDAASARFFAVILETGLPPRDQNELLLAVSRTSDPTGTWDYYLIPVGIPMAADVTFFSDYPTLAVDSNGVYFGLTIFPSNGGSFAKIVATPKTPLIAATPSLGTVTQVSDSFDLYSSPQPAHNHDAVPANGVAFFVASSTTVFGNVNYRAVTWIAGVPSFGASGVVTTPQYDAPLNAPASGSTTPINVGDDRLQKAVIRNNRLWTCRNVGVNSTGGTAGSDRTGIEWLELTITGPTLGLNQSGRVFDSAAVNPQFYYYPSLDVNGANQVAMGFSGSSGIQFVGAYVTGRQPGDAAGTMGAVDLIRAGGAAYNRNDSIGRNRWGDYSHMSVDPTDDRNFWTIQEYATATANIWGTRVHRLDVPAVATATPSLTPSRTPSPSPSLTPSPSPSQTPSITISTSPSPSASPSCTCLPITQTLSLSPSRTASRTPSPTPSRTPSQSPTESRTPMDTCCASLTPSASLTPNLTPTPTETPTLTPPSTATPAPTDSISPTPSLTPLPPVIFLHPRSQKVNVGFGVAFDVGASDPNLPPPPPNKAPGGALAYQWIKNSTPIPLAIDNFVFFVATAAENGAVLEADVTGPGGTARSNPATLTVFDPPAANSAAFLQSTVPAQIYANESLLVGITMQNTSAVTWAPAQNYALGVTSDPSAILQTGGSNRVFFSDPSTVVEAQTGIHDFVAAIEAPAAPGVYTARVRMVQEGLEFFGDEPTLTFNVVPRPNASAEWEIYE